jgi:hypothetical protein
LTSIKPKTLRPVALILISAGMLAVSVSAGWSSTPIDAVVTTRFNNGISARVYPAEYLAEHTTIESARGTLDLGNGETLQVITDINDPLIANKGDGRFHPFTIDGVLECLGRIEYPRMGVEIEVFILPYPRVALLASSAVGNRVFLSPHVLDVSPEGMAYIVAHEMGHVFQYSHLPVGVGDGWDEYCRIRGILGDPSFSDSAPHAYCLREVFAEDFRVLFGGPDAYFEGRVENPELPSPVTVAGLKDFFLGLTTRTVSAPAIVSLGSYPNPFNPQTEIRVALSPDFLAATGDIRVRIYDVRGALVRELFSGRPQGTDIRIRWDGRDQEGRQVASSTYFGVVEAGSARMSIKLLMIK